MLPQRFLNQFCNSDVKIADRALVWFRNDLRVIDHVPLAEASSFANLLEKQGSFVLGLFLYNPHDFKAHDWGIPKLNFLRRNLIFLSNLLWEKYNIPLLILNLDDQNISYSYLPSNTKKRRLGTKTYLNRKKKLAQEFLKLCQGFKISQVYFHSELGPDEKERDAFIVDELEKSQISCFYNYNDQTLFPPGTLVSKSTGEPYKVFTPFRKLWAASILPIVKTWCNPMEEKNTKIIDIFAWFKSKHQIIPNKPNDEIIILLRDICIESMKFLKELSLPTDSSLEEVWPVGEEYCITTLFNWMKTNIKNYNISRNFPANESGTSRISPYLAIGVISIRTILRMVLIVADNGAIPLLESLIHKKQITGAACYLSELCWREFYRNILFSFPEVGKGYQFKSDLKGITWRDIEADPEAKKDWVAWCKGETGFPIVDAAMRELLARAWMHNRSRMIVASFLTKDLLIDWRLGEKFFVKHLIDADLASNNGGWQWCASTGADSQPYFRIFNPINQGRRWDSDGEYIRKWVPELSNLPISIIHNPLEFLTQEEFDKLGYPKPIVNHATARIKALNAFKSSQKTGNSPI